MANPGEEAPGRAGGCAWATLDKAHRSRGCGCAGGCPGGQCWLTQCAVELRLGLQQAATVTALLEDSLKRVDREAAPPPSSAEALDKVLKTYTVSDILQPPRKKGATEPGTPTGGSPRSLGSGVR